MLLVCYSDTKYKYKTNFNKVKGYISFEVNKVPNIALSFLIYKLVKD